MVATKHCRLTDHTPRWFPLRTTGFVYNATQPEQRLWQTSSGAREMLFPSRLSGRQRPRLQSKRERPYEEGGRGVQVIITHNNLHTTYVAYCMAGYLVV